MLRCTNCPSTTGSSPDVAEFVQGWRIWEGTTVGGQHKREVLCPACSGCAPQREDGGPGWSARCHTCEWDWREECYEDGPLTEQEAKELASEPVCEPWTEAYEIKPSQAQRAVVTIPSLAGVL